MRLHKAYLVGGSESKEEEPPLKDMSGRLALDMAQENDIATNINKITQSSFKLYILYTGGTIGMLHDDSKGLIPVKGNLKRLIDKINIDKRLNITYKIERTEPLIDSSDLRTDNWRLMLEKLYANYNNYDSFIVIHGTDTLAYTASALSFFLKDWNKTVIVTGSQIPLFEFRNDAFRNILDSVIVSLFKILGVLIVFGGKILRGNRSSKYSSTDFVAYKSPVYGNIGNIGVHITLDETKMLSNKIDDGSKILVYHISNKPSDWNINWWNTKKIKIYNFTLLPDENSTPLRALIDLNPNAIILQTYGIGNAPVSDEDFMSTLKYAISKNIVIVNKSQCFEGGVNMEYYNTGKELSKLGILSCNDMTYEATFTKLFFLFQTLTNQDGSIDLKQFKHLFENNLAGELSIDTYNKEFRTYLSSYFNDYQEL